MGPIAVFGNITKSKATPGKNRNGLLVKNLDTQRFLDSWVRSQNQKAKWNKEKYGGTQLKATTRTDGPNTSSYPREDP